MVGAVGSHSSGSSAPRPDAADVEQPAYETVRPQAYVTTGAEERDAVSTRRGVGTAAAGTLAMLLALAVLAGPGPEAPREAALVTRIGALAMLTSKAEVVRKGSEESAEAGSCEVDDGIFLPGNELGSIRDVASAEECCDECRAHKTCLAWSWGKARSELHSKVCFLKGAAPRALTKVSAADFVSGQTHQADKEGAPLEVKSREQGQSLYCFSLVQPKGYELELIEMQFNDQASIFMCDEYALFSNRRIEVTPNLWTGIINSTLQCEMGGEFGTALNTGIFLALWAKIILDGRFIYHDWTVKADPDAVFLPGRLRTHLMNHLEDENGVYINNCKFGMHGPLEVFSRNAVKAWALGAWECVKYFTELCSGTCGWGEDMFVDQCMQKKLDVRRDNDFALLLEDHCDPPTNWDDCTNGTVAAFHPFKTKAGWTTCLRRAKSIGSHSLNFKKL